ncbi:hypothetical protein GO495_00655 [Chitinophaga oryziterrae]|uniref:Uncharacterized protein n=1 Tax=Chitinophaga oryziterrae TaxID=1031224 RepID=A0A6N8J1I9_9BACT|nr:hypothetical protein [Chitinophaga oryziterrae]MVT39077.1 hypothetical protein [Chitinophaga oryziterrae]
MKKAPDPSLASVLQNRAKKETDRPADEKVIIPDECGDTLWDDVLAQDEVKDKHAHPDKES